MREAVFQVMDSWGSIGIFLLILIENLFPPIPSEVILTFGGFMTTYTAMTAGEAIAAATAGSVAGAVVLYGAGRLATPSRLERFLGGRVGTLLHFQKEDVEDAAEWFEKRGKAAVLFCRCVPIIRSLISIPAGMAQMALAPFLFLTTVGSLIWNTVLICAGAAAGASWERVMETVDAYSNTAVWAAGCSDIGSTLHSQKRKEKSRKWERSRERKKINPCFTWRLPALTGIKKMRLIGIEPTHTAPEAIALSTELQTH